MSPSCYNSVKLDSANGPKYYLYGGRVILTGTLLAFMGLGITGCASIREFLISAKGLAPSAADEVFEDSLCMENRQYHEIKPLIVKAKEALQKVKIDSNGLTDAQMQFLKSAASLLLMAKNYAECPEFFNKQLSVLLKDAYSPLRRLTSKIGPDESLENPLNESVKTIDDILADYP